MTPPWQFEIPNWVDRVKPCRLCGKPIRVMRAKTEGGGFKVQIVDADPKPGGWVRAWLNDRTISVRHEPIGTVPGDPYIPFHRHQCPERSNKS